MNPITIKGTTQVPLTKDGLTRLVTTLFKHGIHIDDRSSAVDVAGYAIPLYLQDVGPKLRINAATLSSPNRQLGAIEQVCVQLHPSNDMTKYSVTYRGANQLTPFLVADVLERTQW